MIDILCDTCTHNLNGRCILYDVPILHDTRFCDGYDELEEVKIRK